MNEGNLVEYLESVELKIRFRGYDQIEVDEMIDSVTSEVKNLHDDIKVAEERLSVGEKYLETEIKRLDQKNFEVESLLEEAKKEASRIIDSAKTESEELIAASEEEVHSLVEKEKNSLRSEFSVIQNKKLEIENNIVLIENQFSAHRERLFSALGDLQNLIEDLTLCPEELKSISTRENEEISEILDNLSLSQRQVKTEFSEGDVSLEKTEILEDIKFDEENFFQNNNPK